MEKTKAKSNVKVINVTPSECTVIFYENTFRLSFDDYPWFFGASVEEIQQVNEFADTVEWEALDVHLSVDSMKQLDPNKYLGFTKEQLDRLKKYNDEQIKNGKPPYSNARLLDFPYWRQINEN